MNANDSTLACTIGLDLGTTALKGVLLASDGRVLHTAERPVHYRYPAPERVELEAQAHWLAVAGLIRELAGVAPGPLRALAMAGASGNTLLTDAGGQPLTPIINWMDRRCAGHPPSALDGLTVAELRRVTGWPCLDCFPLAHLAWLQEHEAALYRSAERVCMNTDWLLFRLTGQWVMDTSTATTFHLQHQVDRRWHRPYLERLGIRESQLSRLVGAGTVAGPLHAAAAAATGLTTDTLVVTGCFDHPAGALASGVLEPGRLLLSCGTSWVGFTPLADRQAILDAEMLCDPFRSDRGGPWAGLFSVPAIGPVINWYVDNLIAPGEQNRLRIFNELAAQAPAGAGGLVVDLLAPPQPVKADRALISRAVMEGAARALNAKLQLLKAQGLSFERAVLIGGPGRSPVWPGIIADITGLELVVGSPHAGATGAAMLAATGAGISSGARAPSDPTDPFPKKGVS